MTDDLVAFLRARLDEDERAAKLWLPFGNPHPEYTEHIARHDPARVLREVEAKRRIIDEHREISGECQTCAYFGDDEDSGGNVFRYRENADYPCMTVQLLALPYADHPDYQADWRP